MSKLSRLNKRVWAYIDRHIIRVTMTALVVALVALLLAPQMVITIEAGHDGVLWKRFAGGTVGDRTYDEGTHLIFPWDEMTIYDTRVQLAEQDFPIMSLDGLTIVIKVAARYHLIVKELPTLHRFVGPHYREILLMPSIGSAVRNIAGAHMPEDIYAGKRPEMKLQVAELVRTQLQEAFNPPGHEDIEYLVLEDVQFLTMKLPDMVQAAIDRKNEQYHVSQEYAFRVEREQKESARKRIEAEGIRDFQQIIASGISDSLLRWKGIEATLALAQSNNSKIVVIGSGKDGMPIILGNVDGPTAPAPLATGPLAGRPPTKTTEPTNALSRALKPASLEEKPAADLITPPGPAPK
jgi:regulator of protease activity HflC (stomatin/prohibitin superfamily)